MNAIQTQTANQPVVRHKLKHAKLKLSEKC